MKVTKIYFDMDGVLADFNEGAMRLAGVDASGYGNRPKEYDDYVYEQLSKVERFYDKLNPMDGALELFGKVYSQYGERCEILTGIPKPKRNMPTSAEDKVTWVRRILSKDVVVNAVYRQEKAKFCVDKGCILIDDLQENINSWEDMGGTGILHISSEDTINKLKEMGILD